MGDRAKPDNPPSGFRGRVVSSGDSQVSNGNIANIITIVRILLAPLFVWLVLLDGGDHGVWRLVAAALFIAAIATDGLDGALARKRNLITELGNYPRPHRRQGVDRGALIALALVAELPWWVVVVILARSWELPCSGLQSFETE